MNIIVFEDDANVGEPSEHEVRMYATFLGIDLEKEPHLKWIAREGIVAPVPKPWRACTENGLDEFYFNFETGESVWDHPCDQKYRNMVEECRAKRVPSRFVVRRFLPSRAMKAELNEMWCTPIMKDGELVATIQADVEAKFDMCPQLCAPSLFPGFVEMLLKYVEVTQEQIDDAWLDAAESLLGRPAIQQTPMFTDCLLMFDTDMEDPYESTEDDDHHVSTMRPDYEDVIHQMSTFGVDSLHTDDESARTSWLSR